MRVRINRPGDRPPTHRALGATRRPLPDGRWGGCEPCSDAL